MWRELWRAVRSKMLFLPEKIILFTLSLVGTALLGALFAWRVYIVTIRQEKKESPSPVERSNRILRRKG